MRFAPLRAGVIEPRPQAAAHFAASRTGSAPSTYRPDIDGLRAVAVLSVIAFHYGFPAVTGGFVGVDVFFVISGYLITGITVGETEGGRFSVTSFYERRLRRIAPALLVLLLFCAGAGIFVFLPGDMRLIGSSLTNAAAFTSNVLFYTVANNYFAADNLTLQPLLHTWSLSVEAQFYLVYPWAILLLRHRGFPLAPSLAVLLLLSLAISSWGATHSPTATFYLLPSRAWELLLGGLLVFLPRSTNPMGRWTGRLALPGLVLIAAAALLFTRTTPFPGAAALLPCIGAALVILAGTRPDGHATLAGRFLGAPPLVFLGRISYSLYLWHWPILVLASYGRSSDLGLGEKLGLTMLSGGVATISWWLVERPFIARKLLPTRRRLFVGALLGTIVAAGLGVVVDHAGRGEIPLAQLPPDILTLANGQFDLIKGDCGPEDVGGATRPPCRFGVAGKAPSFVLWGNSYARMWTPTLDIDAARNDMAGVSLLRSKCLPLLGLNFPGLADCAPFNEAAFAYIAAHPALKTVVLGANWFAGGDQLAALETTITRLQTLHVRIFILLAPPQALFMVPRTLAMAALRHLPPPPPIDEADARTAQKPSTDLIAALAAKYGLGLIDPASVLCEGTHCAIARDGHPIYFDAGHVTLYAALHSAGLFEPVFAP